jgi:hypothetical protein
MTTTATKNDVYQSRFGFHPVDYETCRKLKTLHKRYWETVYAVARWMRWDRKTVHQHGPEPKYCTVFVEEQGHWQRFKNRDGYTGKKYCQKTLNDQGVVEAYHQARMPKKADDVKPISISPEEIDRLYNEVEDWFAEN